MRFLSSLVIPGRCPLSISAFSTQLRRVSGLTPSFWPTLASVPPELPDAARNSKTIATARSRSSAGCCFRDVMSPNFPRGHSLQETRGGPHRGLFAHMAKQSGAETQRPAGGIGVAVVGLDRVRIGPAGIVWRKG